MLKAVVIIHKGAFLSSLTLAKRQGGLLPPEPLLSRPYELDGWRHSGERWEEGGESEVSVSKRVIQADQKRDFYSVSLLSMMVGIEL